jgi:hypothetical protein
MRRQHRNLTANLTDFPRAGSNLKQGHSVEIRTALTLYIPLERVMAMPTKCRALERMQWWEDRPLLVRNNYSYAKDIHGG